MMRRKLAILERQEDQACRLACPDCGHQLNQSDRAQVCTCCGKTWPVVDGIPHFVDDFPYWGEIPQEEMREVNRKAAAGSWKSALLDSTEPAVQRASGMILNLDRANWQWLIPLPADSRVLDLGAGTGTNTHALAKHFREVVAVEPVLERVQFMRHRFAQERLSNTRLIRSSLWKLPFEPRSFDLAVMNGVLEWVPEGREEDPRELQLEALKKVQSLLRPGGYLYLGIENRVTLGYCLGYRDPHSGIPFVTILPRRLAHWYSRRKGLLGYRNYLYSSRGYRKLLSEAGFSNIDVYLALPSYNHPRYLIPVDQHLYSYFSRTFNATHTAGLRGWIRSLLNQVGLLKHLQYSFVIMARK